MSKKNKILILIVCIVSFLVIAVSVTLLSLYVAEKTNVDFIAGQVEQTSNIHIKWETDKNVDEVIIEISKGGKVINKKSITKKSELKLCKYTLKGAYGENKVKLTIKNKLYKKSVIRTITIYRY